MATSKPPGQLAVKERAELRSLVRAHYDVLLKEIAAAEQNALAEVSRRVAQIKIKRQEQGSKFHTQCDMIVAQANAKIHSLVGQYPEMFGEGGQWRSPNAIHNVRAYRREEDSNAMHRAMVDEIRARATAARTRVQRQRTEQLREIALDALVTERAREIVFTLPQVEQVFDPADLIPALTA